MLCLYDTPRKSAMKTTGYASLHFSSERAKKNTFVLKNHALRFDASE
jgi:hypothetical protein